MRSYPARSNLHLKANMFEAMFFCVSSPSLPRSRRRFNVRADELLRSNRRLLPILLLSTPHSVALVMG